MINWILSSSVLIVLVILLRAMFKGRIKLHLQYALWLPVLIRLLLPFSFGSSEASVANYVPAQEEIIEYFVIDSVPDSEFEAVLPEVQDVQYEQQPKPISPVRADLDTGDILNIIWALGAALVFSVILISNLHFALKLRRSRRETELGQKLPVYICKWLETPCLFGFFKPAIYISHAELGDEIKLRHVLIHEQMHYRQLDHLWAVLRSLCLVIHWYNPLVWLAAKLSRCDGELSCDESVIKHIGEAERAQYGHTLIALSHTKPSLILSTATGMSDGGIKERIRLIAKRPRMAVMSLISVILLSALAVGCTYAGAAEETPQTPLESPVPTEKTEHTPKPESEEKPNAMHHVESINSSDGMVEFMLDYEIPQLADAMPIVEAEARELTVEDGKKTAQAIFGTSELYERTKNYFMGTLQEIPTKEAIDEFLAYGRKLQADEELLKAVCGTDYEIMGPDLVSNLLDTYGNKAYYDAAVSDSERSIMQWEFKPDENQPELNRILGSYEKDGLRYRFLMTNSNVSYGIPKSILVTIENSNLAYMNQQQAYFERSSEAVPDTQQFAAAQYEAQRIMDEIEPGKWMIESCAAQKLTNGRYIIQIDAQPVYASWPIIKQDEFNLLYDCEEMFFELGVDGSLLYMCYKNPGREIQRSEQNSVLNYETAMNIAREHFKQASVSEYDYWVTGPEGTKHDGVSSKVYISDMQQGWLRVPAEGEEDKYTLQPVISFIGYFESFDVNGEETEWSVLRPNTPKVLVNISALDGSILKFSSKTHGENGLPRN